jgi:hypothetical protein
VGDFNLNFDGDDLEGRYLIELQVTFQLSRHDGEAREMSITSSDLELLKPISSVNDPADENQSDGEESSTDFEQAFEVLGAGEVTLTFKDGDDVVLTREVSLIDADELKAERTTYADLLLALSETETQAAQTIGAGERVVVGGRYDLTLNAYLGDGEAQEMVDFHTYAQTPTSEQADVITSGKVLEISPRQAGEVTVEVKLGGQVTELRFQGVSADEIASIVIEQGDSLAGGEGDESSLNRFALATTRDASDTLIYGADVTWTRLAADGETELDEVISGELVHYEHSETEQVSFKVTAGNQTHIVELPMSSNGDLFASGNGTFGCDASGGLSGQIPLSLLLMAIFAIRRRQSGLGVHHH